MLRMNSAILLLLTHWLVPCDAQQCGHWDYGEEGPDVWREACPDCGGKRQSPINIRTACTIQDDFNDFYFSPAHMNSIRFTLMNNGHTIRATTEQAQPLTIRGGNLDGTFVFDSFHLHWGPNHNTGSEHQV